MRLEVSFRVLNKNLDVDFSAKDKKLNAEFQCFQRITEQGDVDYYDGYATTKQSWGSKTTTVYAFNGTNYYKSATYGSPTATNITLGISDGKLTGLPSGLSGGSLLVTRGI